MSPNNKKKLGLSKSAWKMFVLTTYFALAVFTSKALAQYTGGAQNAGSAESTIGSDIFQGGAQTGVSSASSSGGSLSHGVATKLVFTVSPNTIKHIFAFTRQPVVAIQDADGNVVTSDNSTQVTIEILNNPGNGDLLGTTTVTAVNGLARFTNLKVTGAGNLYTFKATALGLTAGVSATFDILGGTGVKVAAIWDNVGAAYSILSWIETDNQRDDLDGGTTCQQHTIYKGIESEDTNYANYQTFTPVLDTDND